MAESTITQRMYLISQLEAHFGRQLRQRIVADSEDVIRLMKSQEEMGLLDRRVALTTFGKWVGQYVDAAVEASEALEAARQCPDSLLPDLVRWQTLPDWKNAMIAAGFEFDVKTMRWTEEW